MNLATGEGFTVLEVIHEVERVIGQPINCEITCRREIEPINGERNRCRFLKPTKISGPYQRGGTRNEGGGIGRAIPASVSGIVDIGGVDILPGGD